MDKNEWDRQKDLEHFIQLWASRKSSGMNQSKEAWDKRADGWEEGLKNDQERSKRSSERVDATVAYLKSKGILSAEDEVIDIGCGPGRFVAEFARTSAHVVGTDISSSMCEYGMEFARSQGLSNVSFVPCDFKQTDIDEMGWRGRFDLVFSSITPAMSSPESLEKSIAMSRKYCFQSNFVKMVDDLVYDVIREEFPDIPIMERSIRSTYILTNILWLKGYFPEVTYYREESRKKQAVDEKLVRQVLNQVPRAEEQPNIHQKITDSLMKRADRDGNIDRYSVVTYAWVLWDVRKNDTCQLI